MTCIYNYYVGTSYLLPGPESEAYEGIGFNLPAAGGALMINYAENVGTSPVTGVDWAAVGNSTWTPRALEQENTIVPPGFLAEVYQIGGKCGMYSIESNEFDIRLIDEEN